MGECERCNGGSGVSARLRLLWDTDRVAALCDPCNDVVQGPDHADIETENLA